MLMTNHLKLDDNTGKILKIIAERNRMSTSWFFEEPKDMIYKYAKPLLEDLKAWFEQTLSSRQFKHILIHGDYDTDGITASTIFAKTISKILPDSQIQVYLPRRDDGYGFTQKGYHLAQSLPAESLVVCLDCGTNSEMLYQAALEQPAKQYLVIDHHLLLDPKSMTPPPNLKIFNAHQYRQIELSAAGMAFVTALALLGSGVYQSDLVGMAAIGLVGDVMPLNNPLNFAIVKAGLQYLNREKPAWAVGLNTRAEFSSESLGFYISPRLNAIGRTGGDPILAYQALNGDTDAIAELNRLNGIRQNDVQEIINTLLSEKFDEFSQQSVIFAEIDTKPGYVGLVASKLCEIFSRPALVACRQADSCVGSARSIHGVHLIEHVFEPLANACLEINLRFGGHELAAGFGYPRGFGDRIAQTLQTLPIPSPKQRVEELHVEIGLSPSQQLAGAVASFLTEPHGLGNPKPVYFSDQVLLTAKPIKEGKYTSFIASLDGQSARLVFWQPYELVNRFFEKYNLQKDLCRVYFTASYNPSSDFPISLQLTKAEFGESITLNQRNLLEKG